MNRLKYMCKNMKNCYYNMYIFLYSKYSSYREGQKIAR